MTSSLAHSILILPFAVLGTLGSAAFAQPVSLDGVPGCSQISAPLSGDELLKTVSGQIVAGPTALGGSFTKTYSPLDQADAMGVMTFSSGDAVSKYRYWIDGDRVCAGLSFEECEQIAHCTEGTVPFVTWFVGDEASPRELTSITPDPVAARADMPVVSVSPKPDYDISAIAPAADWSMAETDAFRGLAGLNGIYIAEGASDGPIIDDYLVAQDFSTGRRGGDNRRMVGNLIRVHQPEGSATAFYSFAMEGGTWEAMFGLHSNADDILDLSKATPGVIDLATDSEGFASPKHWAVMNTHLLWTYADWDPATHAAPIVIRVITPFDDLLSRSILLCDSAEMMGGAPQSSLFKNGDTCRRYDRGFEVTDMLAGKNALQVVAAIKGSTHPMLMTVGELAVSGDTITVKAGMISPILQINTGQFQGWDAWMDRVNTAGSGRGRPVFCQFPISAADRLASLEVGAVLAFFAELEDASDRAVRLNCRLP
ncbi:MAG: hypothetical protein NXH97_15205 [Rhodobacteraceae bacterium]|nr:hypothetical protein [Paracoccaceae bacterium]